jgi:hypothetical protein
MLYGNDERLLIYSNIVREPYDTIKVAPRQSDPYLSPYPLPPHTPHATHHNGNSSSSR